jgi:hypothetical protein
MSNRPPSGERDDFDPGLSFTDDPAGEVTASELPSWLRSFAEAAEDDAAGNPAARSPRTAASVARSSESPALDDDPLFPGWLDAPRGNRPQAPGSLVETVGPSFFSEDDLPDWLRALSTDTPAPAAPAAAASAGSAPATAARPAAGVDPVVYVPQVSRVWVHGDDAEYDSESASLFAAIAHGASDRPDVLVDERPSGPAAAMVAPEVAGRSEPRARRERPADGSWTRRERILMVLVIIMTIVMFLVLGVNVNG